MISETWLAPHTKFSVSGYNIFRKNRDDHYGGVCILVKRKFQYQELSHYNRLQQIMCVGVRVFINSRRSYIIYSIYKRPQDFVSAEDWVSFFRSLEKPFLVGGDVNVHDKSWGCSVSDRGGRAFLESVEQENLIIFNDGSPTLLSSPGSSLSAIDLTLSTPSLAPYISWMRTDETLGSDHFAILVTLSFPSNTGNMSSKGNSSRWNLKHAEWSVFEREMENLTANSVSLGDCSYSTFINNLNKANSAAIARTNNSKSSANFRKSWWTEECKVARNNRKQSMLNYKSNPTLENFLKYKQSVAITKRVILESKRSSWKLFCSNLNRYTPSKVIWQKIN